ncbi:MAG: hypothetical protein EGQ34_08140 [Sutterella sp.]|nr:hypothetical protein [Sutterella sp.]
MRAKPILLSACAALALGLSFLSAPALAASEMEELAATLHPGDFSPRVEQLLTNGHPAQALELADIGIKRNPRNAQLQFLRTVSLESLGRTEDAALSDNARYRCRSIPSIGALLTDEDLPDKQLKLL